MFETSVLLDLNSGSGRRKSRSSKEGDSESKRMSILLVLSRGKTDPEKINVHCIWVKFTRIMFLFHPLGTVKQVEVRSNLGPHVC